MVERGSPATGADASDESHANFDRCGRTSRRRDYSCRPLLIEIGAPRLRSLGVAVPPALPLPEHRLYTLLARHEPESAHSRYNALLRRRITQALAKIELGHATDQLDVTELIRRGLVDPGRLMEYFEAIAPNLYKCPALDPDYFPIPVTTSNWPRTRAKS